MTNKTHEHARIAEIAAQVTAVAIAVLLSGISLFGMLCDNSKTSPKDIEVRINPNDAPVGSLVRLNNIGVGKATAIIAYRESISGNKEKVFCSPQDLEKVKGIGPKTVAGNIELLKFE